MVGARQNEIDHLHRRIDDAQTVGVLLQRRGEELLVKLHQHPLPGGAVVQAAGAQADAFVEALQVAHLVLQAEFAEVLAQGVQGLGHRVGGGEVVVLEQRLEHRAGEDVLGHHLHGVGAADGVVDGGFQFLVEGVEPFAQRFVAGGAEQAVDALHQAGEDVRHVLGPSLPILAVAALLHDLGEDRARRQIHGRERQVGRVRLAAHALVVAAIAVAEDDAAGGGVVQVDPVDLGVEPVVVGAQRPQDAPDRGEALVVVQHRRRADAGRHGDGQDDVAVFLAFGLAHGAAHGLDDIDMRTLGAHEQHGVQGRHVDALGQAAGVGEDAAGSVGAAFQPFDAGLALQGVVLAVHMLGAAAEGAGALLGRQRFDGVADDAVPVVGEALGGGDGVGEGDGAGQGLDWPLAAAPILRVPQRLPAADDLGGVGDVDLAAFGGQMGLQGGVHMPLGHGQHHHLVVGQKPLLHGAGEGQAVELRAVDGRVVHGEHLHRMAGGLGLGALRVEARRGGHVEALGGADAPAVMDQAKGGGVVAGALNASGAVRLVAEDQVEGRGAVALRPLQDGERLVGAENHRHSIRAGCLLRKGRPIAGCFL